MMNIDKGIDFPKLNSRMLEKEDTISSMVAGDSLFFTNTRELESWRQAIKKWLHRSRLSELKVATRAVDGGYRLWLIYK